jgi:hypothetical protein
MTPIRTYAADLHGQRVQVKVYPPQPAVDRIIAWTVTPYGARTGIVSIVVDPTYHERPTTKHGATERGGRCRAPAKAADVLQ